MNIAISFFLHTFCSSLKKYAQYTAKNYGTKNLNENLHSFLEFLSILFNL